MAESRTTHLVGAIVTLALIAGILLSVPLWLTREPPEFPMSPVLNFLGVFAPSEPFDVILLIIVLIALVLAALFGQRTLYLLSFALCLLLAVSDQMRWQPWFYQYVAMLGALGISKNPIWLMRLIVSCVYVYSGINKVNAAYFKSGMGFIIDGLPQYLASAFSQLHLAYAAPFIEIVTGLALLFGGRKVRSLGVVSAIGIHLLLLVALGPFGLSFNSVVWPWNIAMIALVVLLFTSVRDRFALSSNTVGGAYGFAVVLLFAVMPILGVFGYWPSYLSFALYSENTASGYVYDGDVFEPIVNRAYDELNVPAYPELSVFRDVALSECEENTEGYIILVVDGRPAMLSGKASRERFFCTNGELSEVE